MQHGLDLDGESQGLTQRRLLSLTPALALAWLVPSVVGGETAVDPITPEEVLEHVEVLSSDVFAGRATGTAGERRAAAYIVSLLEEIDGIEPAGPDGEWTQPFDVVLSKERRRAAERRGEIPERGVNVLARLPGADPELAQQAIVVGAHYDHVGTGQVPGARGAADQVFNGADDNASGTSVLIELAARLASSEERPRRTILFQWYSGEEYGLLGSQHWVDAPLHPIEDVVAMLNMDMVGRLKGSTLLVGGTGTSPGFPELTQRLATDHGLAVIDDPPGEAPSDNTPFYNAGIPVLFFFTGVHDDYHKASDDSEKVNAEGAARIGRFVHDIVTAIDGADERPEFTEAPGKANIFTPRAHYGLALGLRSRRAATFPGAVEVAVVLPGDGAADAGLAEGDVVLSIDGEAAELGNAYTLLEEVDAALSPKRMEIWRPASDDVEETDGERLVVAVKPVIR